jgi:monoamine oxidase
VELGAEFVHGAPQSTRDLLRECGENTIGTQADAFELRDGALHDAPDRDGPLEAVLQRIDANEPDCSIESFLAGIPRSELSDADRQSVRSMVEGFDAALVSDASTIAIANEWRSGVNNFASRPVSGYAPLMQHLARMVSDRTLLRTVVERIEWSPGNVRIAAVRCGEFITIDAACCIVTVPAGVLSAQRDLFAPALPQATRDAIAAIAMGPVVRVILDFRSLFWESLEEGRFRNAGFFSVPDAPMRTIWTRAPQQTPLVVAWAGGGAAKALIDAGADPIESALATVERVFPSVDVRGELRTAYFHDWQADPYARGAYSYLRVGAGNARATFARPIENTIFFAGEAASSDDAGTVAGALDTGYSSGVLIPI